MLCNKCNRNVEPERLVDRDHYKCECGQRWDTDKPPIGPGSLFRATQRKPCKCAQVSR